MRIFFSISIFLMATFGQLFGDEFPQWHHSTQNTLLKKEGFVRTLLPIIESENQKILEEREFVAKFFENNFINSATQKHPKSDVMKLAKLAKKYKIEKMYDKNEYLSKIDTIPPSIALGQAALESSWGRSSYAKDLNNLYGHYAFKNSNKQQGKMVNGRKIRGFDSLNDAVAEYLLNLNSHSVYSKFREQRVAAKEQNKDFDALKAIKTLTKYSELGGEYIHLLRDVILVNNYLIFDKKVSTEKADIKYNILTQLD